MKNFTKKLALFLALAMVVTLVHPTSVFAASKKITLKSGKAAPATVYAGKTYNLKVAGVKVKFYTSNKKVATIGATTGKMKVVAPGKVTITAKNAKTKKVVAKKAFTVLQRAKSIAADKELFLGAVGDTATIKVTKTPATSTDVVRFASADKTIATVGATSGKVTAVKEGKVTVTVYAKATKATANSNKANVVATVDVYVGTVLDTVAQTKVDTLKATFKADVAAKTLAPADFTVTNKETSVVEAVKEVKVEGKEATLTMYNEIKDGKTYTVKYGEFTAEFTATDGKAVKLDINPKEIPVNTPTEVKVVKLDANGVIVGELTKSEADKDSYVDFDFEVKDGYVNGDKIAFYNLTSTAVAKATLHTFVYENGTETGVVTTGDVTIKATAQATVSKDGVSYTIAKVKPDFSAKDYKQCTSLPVNAEGYKVFFKMLKSDKTEVEDYSVFKLSSTNNMVLMVAETITETAADVVAVGEGSANIVVKNAAGTVVATLPVTVGKAPVPSKLTFDVASVTLSNSEDLNDEKTVTIEVKDQYGNDVTGGELCVEGITAGAEEVAPAEGKVTFHGAKVEAKTYLYKVYYKLEGKNYLTTNYRVVVQNLDKTKTEKFAAVLDKSTVDTTVNAEKYEDQTVQVSLAQTFGDVLASKVNVNGTDVKILSIKDAAGVDLDSKFYDPATGKIFATKKDGAYVQKIPAGTYKIVVQREFDAPVAKKLEGDPVSSIEPSTPAPVEPSTPASVEPSTPASVEPSTPASVEPSTPASVAPATTAAPTATASASKAYSKYEVTLTVTDKQPAVTVVAKKRTSEETELAKIVSDVFNVSYNGKNLDATKDWSFDLENSKTVISPDKKTVVFKKAVVRVMLTEEIGIEVTKNLDTSVVLKNAMA